MLELKLNLPLAPEKEVKLVPADPNHLYDLIILGGGPAGMTAAVYAARKRIDTLLISKDVGGQLLWTSDIENYLGYRYISGMELSTKFADQVNQFGLPLILGNNATKLDLNNNIFRITLESNIIYQSRTVIYASGKRYRFLNVPGEKELVGHGVGFCATCDAPLFLNKDVAVVGGGNSGLQAVIDLLKVPAHHIYLINKTANWHADKVLLEKALYADKVTPLPEYIVTQINGVNEVSGIKLKSLKDNTEKEIKVTGVFIEIGLEPNSELVAHLVALNQGKEIIVDAKCNTNIPGLFAAGDVTNVPDKQIIIAAGEGSKSALSAYEYLLQQH
ncbi:MAG: NAD(P)/FAD-dependent oxidoreductase [bacterium]